MLSLELLIKVWRKVKEKFFNTYRFSNHSNKKFSLLWQKGVYNCGYINDWETVNGTPLPEKKDFYIFLNVEDITDADYSHVKKEFVKVLK